MNLNEGKIIGIGFHKTGTSTLGNALEILNYNVKGVGPRMILPILAGKLSKVLKYADRYDAFQDVPWCILFKEMDARFPGSKFILTVRNEESWYKSALKQFGTYIRPQNEWIYGRKNGLFKNKELAINRYRKHNSDVLNYFKNRPNDLLIIDFTKGDAWDKLCGFLGIEVPKVAFPHTNRTSEKQNENTFKSEFKVIRRKIKNTIKIKYADLMGYWK